MPFGIPRRIQNRETIKYTLVTQQRSLISVTLGKSYKFRTYTIDIHKIIHKNEINDYSSAFRTLSYRLIFATLGKAKITKIG